MAEKLAIDGGQAVCTEKFPPWPWFTDEIVQAAMEPLKTGRVNYWTGELGMKFEQAFADWNGAKFGISTSNGTSALHIGAGRAWNRAGRRGDRAVVHVHRDVVCSVPGGRGAGVRGCREARAHDTGFGHRGQGVGQDTRDHPRAPLRRSLRYGRDSGRGTQALAEDRRGLRAGARRDATRARRSAPSATWARSASASRRRSPRAAREDASSQTTKMSRGTAGRSETTATTWPSGSGCSNSKRSCHTFTTASGSTSE